MPASALSNAELIALQLSGLPVVEHAPFVIMGVSSSIFSTARHAGAATVQGWAYTYYHATDELIREDVATWLRKRRGHEAQARQALARAAQYTLMGD